ncbi:Electron transfer flavoprotein-ubiquinone oxidoreductase [Mycena sanguinolenta]|uniref:Electron transfer flavoprotein-ubiquinone oxidoreductase n=1 Tax=Mycena sanguinolenta TaxID=230812 RepID=A0A8H6X651_9AGAR|nr:Electron transfer flavoprotein-ubiquinone oxidoreductase [Mycena sanguinolenta]
MCDALTTSIILGAISLIPDNHFVLWSLGSASLVLYVADRQRPSNKLGLLETSIDSVGETLKSAKTTCTRNYAELVDIAHELCELKLSVSNIRTRLLETPTISTWKDLRWKELREYVWKWQSIHRCGQKVQVIRTSIERVIAAERQRELSEEIQKSRETILSLTQQVLFVNHVRSCSTDDERVPDALREEDVAHLESETSLPVCVVLLKKGSEIGSNILGGIVIGPTYHVADGLVIIGVAVGLDYKAHETPPHLSALSSPALGAYGARTLTKGGLQCLPRLNFPGRALLGCAAGMVKGTYKAMSNSQACLQPKQPSPRSIPRKVRVHGSPKTFTVNSQPESSSTSESTSEEDGIISFSAYTHGFPSFPAHADLYVTRNVRPAFNANILRLSQLRASSNSRPAI